MRLTQRSEDRADRTFALAKTAADTDVRIDVVNKKILADACRTFLVLDVCLILMTEVAQSREDRGSSAE